MFRKIKAKYQNSFQGENQFFRSFYMIVKFESKKLYCK